MVAYCGGGSHELLTCISDSYSSLYLLSDPEMYAFTQRLWSKCRRASSILVGVVVYFGMGKKWRLKERGRFKLSGGVLTVVRLWKDGFMGQHN